MWDPSATTVVYNPAAAGGRVGRDWGEIEPELRSRLGDVAFVRTRAQGDGIRRARDAVKRGRTTLLSLGGDGTHSEVVNGILSTSPEPGAIRLGVLPAGTGGDFRRLLEHSEDLYDAADNLPTARADRIDAGQVRFVTDEGVPLARYFINIASFGIGGLVDRIVNQSSKRLGGKATFYLATMRAMRQYRPARVRLWVDEVEVGVFDITTIAVANGRYFGGGMMIAPDARLGDGAFEVVVSKSASFLRSLALSPKLYDGSHVHSDLTEVFRGARVRAETLTDHPAYLDIDGEAPGVLPADFDVLPGALTLLGGRPEVL